MDLFQESDYVERPDSFEAYMERTAALDAKSIKENTAKFEKASKGIKLSERMLGKIEQKLDLHGGNTLAELVSACYWIFHNERIRVVAERPLNDGELKQREDFIRKDLATNKSLSKAEVDADVKRRMTSIIQTHRVRKSDSIYEQALADLKVAKPYVEKRLSELVKNYLIGSYGQAEVDASGEVRSLGKNLFVNKSDHLVRQPGSSQALKPIQKG